MANYGTFYYGDGTVYGSVSVVASVGVGSLANTTPAISVAWDYLFINKPKNITNWSSKSKNSTTWIKRPKVLTNWEEI